ncbi:GNAT family N-acetyltransferase [Streptomyces sp. BH106]|uniref:GNAT family N-acetyltransferase n=1 Tax=Streptomyces sp. BH106 TaxID=3410409 RepID=UPI003CE97883
MIRTAVPADAPVLATLHRRARATYYQEGFPDDGDPNAWVERWSVAIARPHGHVLVCVRDGVVVGLASFRRPDEAPADTAVLYQFQVDPDHWSRGIGTELHAACVEQWRVDDVTEVHLIVHGDNTRAQSFYARHGWADEGPESSGSTHRRMRLTLGRE